MDESNVIGEGTYGCVHHPPLLCKDSQKRDLDQISKLMDSAEARSEMKEYALISNVDRSKQFYLGQPTICKLGTQESNKKAIKKCKISANVFKSYDEYSLMLMKNGGNNLKTFAKNMSVKSVTSENKRIMNEFWINVHTLFLGLKEFLKGDIIHHDVKHQNIVYHNETKQIKFIDFGLMTKKSNIIDKLHQEGFWLAMFHWSFPLELGYYNPNDLKQFLKKSEGEKQAHISMLVNEIEQYEKGHHNVSKESMAIVTFIREFHCKKNSFCHKTLQNILDDYALTLYGLNKNTYKEMMEKSYNTVDLYGLGGGLMYVLNHTYKFLDSDFVQELSDLFYHMYHPNLFERYTIENALAKYEQLLEKYLLESLHKEFVNHMIQSISQSKKNITNSLKTISLEKIIKSAKQDKTIIDGPVRQCADDKELNPFTNRCVKKCESGYKRNEKFQCKKDVSKKCPSGKERNPKTRRCVKKCKDDYSRNKDFKCVKTRKIRKDS